MVALKSLALSLAISSFVYASPVPSSETTSAQAQGLAKRQVQVGSVINSCTVPGTVALTFDDGPYIYTSELLDTLASNGVKATFFLNGANFGSIYDFQAQVQRMNNEGHQIGSHTWSHADLATLDQAGITSQMTQVEDALKQIIGKFPTYMRPPYLSTNQLSLQTLGGMGYHVINCDIDTKDFEHQDDIQTSAEFFRQGLDNGGTIELTHDVHEQTVEVLAQEMIDAVKERGLRAVTVGECLGDSAANWYRTSR